MSKQQSAAELRARAMQHHRAGEIGRAADAWARAAQADPNHPETRNNLGVALQALGMLDGAAAAFAEATRLRSDYADAWENRAAALLAMGRTDDAISAAREMMRFLPGAAGSHVVLATTLARAGRFDEAAASCRDGLKIAPGDVDVTYLLANVLAAQERWADAATAYEQVVALAPQALDARVNLGVCRAAAGQLADAARHFRDALKQDASRADAAMRLADVLERLGEHGEAFDAAKRAVQRLPHDPAALNLAASLADRAGRASESEPLYRRALDVDASYAPALSNYATLLARRGEVERAVEMLRRAVAAEPDEPVAHSTLCMYLNAVPDVDPREVFAEHRRWFARHGRRARDAASSETPRRGEPRVRPSVVLEEPSGGRIQDSPLRGRGPEGASRRLRVGYVSPDWAGHPVARFMQPILESHDRQRFEIHIYDDAPRPDSFTDRLRPFADQWHRVRGMPDAALAEQVRRDGIDVLVDLAGHTAGNRLLVFARRPALIQVSYLGYPNTTGLDQLMDTRLTDAIADPPGLADALHVEKLIRLPGTFLSFRPPVETPPVAAAPALKNGYVTFGSFNALWKINAPLLGLWARVLSGVPGSRLLMKADGLERLDVAARVADVFRRHGVSADRLTLLGRERTYAGHLAAYAACDVCLDTFPYTGTTTTCEALWMGVPVVSLAGQVHAARVGASLLSSVGLPELWSESPDALVETARALASDVGRVASLRRHMRERMTGSPLMDPITLTDAIERHYVDLDFS